MLGRHENAVKIRIRAAAVENLANDSLCCFLAKPFGISKTHLCILGGHNSRRKKIRVQTPRNLLSFKIYCHLFAAKTLLDCHIDPTPGSRNRLICR